MSWDMSQPVRPTESGRNTRIYLRVSLCANTRLCEKLNAEFNIFVVLLLSLLTFNSLDIHSAANTQVRNPRKPNRKPKFNLKPDRKPK